MSVYVCVCVRVYVYNIIVCVCVCVRACVAADSPSLHGTPVSLLTHCTGKSHMKLIALLCYIISG